MKSVEVIAGEKGRRFLEVRKLYTDVVDGTEVIKQSWIPKDECNRYGKYVGIRITKEGVYTAPLDGFVRIIVDIPETTSVTGTENGATVTYTVDDDGYLQVSEVS